MCSRGSQQSFKARKESGSNANSDKSAATQADLGPPRTRKSKLTALFPTALKAVLAGVWCLTVKPRTRLEPWLTTQTRHSSKTMARHQQPGHAPISKSGNEVMHAFLMHSFQSCREQPNSASSLSRTYTKKGRWLAMMLA